MEKSFLLPDLSDVDAQGFWEGCAKGELRVQRCAACGEVRFPPRPMCPACRSIESDWQAVCGRGRIWSFVVAHPPLLPAYAEFAPYPVVTVELEEDPALRMVGNLLDSAQGDINEIDPESIQIGEAVRVVFTPVDDVHLPRWVRD